jgi:hypothetical protein
MEVGRLDDVIRMTSKTHYKFFRKRQAVMWKLYESSIRAEKINGTDTGLAVSEDFSNVW